MARGYAAEQVGVLDGTLLPAAKADGRLVNAKLRVFQATLDLSASTTKIASGDDNVLFKIPKGHHPVAIALLGSATMGGTATLAIGITGATGKYRAAAIHTATTLTFSMLSAAADDAPLAADETILLTIAAADLPSSGILQVFFFCTAR